MYRISTSYVRRGRSVAVPREAERSAKVIAHQARSRGTAAHVLRLELAAPTSGRTPRKSRIPRACAEARQTRRSQKPATSGGSRPPAEPISRRKEGTGWTRVRLVERGNDPARDRRLDRPRPPSRRPGRPRRDGGLRRAARVPARARARARDPRRALRLRALRRAHAARGRALRAGRSRPRRVQPAQVPPARAQGPPDDPAAPVRPDELVARRDGARARAARRCGRRSCRSAPVAGTSATCAARRSGCSARAGRSGSTGPSSSRPTATTRSTRCTPPGSATRASSCWRPGG